MRHVLHGFISGFNHRSQLAKILRNSDDRLQTHSIHPETLKSSGVTVLALDFDGVLAPHGADQPLPIVKEWITSCCITFGEGNIFILSNKPTPVRSQWFAAQFPAIRFISGVRKKPYPDGILNVAKKSGVDPSNVILLDDRLLTGALATCLAGSRISYISAPYVDMRKNPFHEIFFMMLRSLERLLISIVSK